jgi:hypothetical protein
MTLPYCTFLANTSWMPRSELFANTVEIAQSDLSDYDDHRLDVAVDQSACRGYCRIQVRTSLKTPPSAVNDRDNMSPWGRQCLLG